MPLRVAQNPTKSCLYGKYDLLLSTLLISLFLTYNASCADTAAGDLFPATPPPPLSLLRLPPLHSSFGFTLASFFSTFFFFSFFSFCSFLDEPNPDEENDGDADGVKKTNVFFPSLLLRRRKSRIFHLLAGDDDDDEDPVELLFLHLLGDACTGFGVHTQYVPGGIPSRSSSTSDEDNDDGGSRLLRRILRLFAYQQLLHRKSNIFRARIPITFAVFVAVSSSAAFRWSSSEILVEDRENRTVEAIKENAVSGLSKRYELEIGVVVLEMVLVVVVWEKIGVVLRRRVVLSCNLISYVCEFVRRVSAEAWAHKRVLLDFFFLFPHFYKFLSFSRFFS
ncbi:hypothetical protein HN873_052311 [Arachis hypogaea]|nr:uncharacterized protein DS421_15g510470 [Arachis hypogaea]